MYHCIGLYHCFVIDFEKFDNELVEYITIYIAEISQPRDASRIHHL